MRALVVASLAIAVVIAPAGADGAREGFPGRNGLVVFASDRTTPSSPEIYAAALSGGAPRNLTRTQEWESGPLVSPDGRRMAFRANVSGGEPGVFLMETDGAGRRLLVVGEQPSWSPDSRALAFEDLRGRISVVDVETGAVRTLADGHLPAWSPDGRHIAFVRGPRLHVVGADGGEVRQLAVGMVSSGVRARAPSWSPDGSRLAFAGGEDDGNGFARTSEIHVVRLTDGATTQLTRGGGAKADPRFAPDGRAIVFSENHPTEPKTELVLVDADGSGRRPLTRGDRFSYDQSASWSPDGGWVAFTRGTAATVATDVLVIRRDGTGLRRLTQPRSGLPAYEGPEWLPDGRTVVFARVSSDRDHDLFTVDPRSGRLRRLTDNLVQDRDPAWSPDGGRIAFVRTLVTSGSRRHENQELFVMRADRTGVRRLTHHRFEDLAPAWSPDGSLIVFVRRVDRGLTALYTIRPDGTGLRRLASRPAGFHSDPAWSPDGRSIAFTAGNGVGEGGRLYVIAANGSRLRRLPDAAEYVAGPRWSPDGRLLAVTGINTCGRACELPGVYVLRNDGFRARKVAEWSVGLDWSPDGRQLVLAAGSLTALDLRSGTTRELVSGKDTLNGHESPDWQPR